MMCASLEIEEEGARPHYYSNDKPNTCEEERLVSGVGLLLKLDRFGWDNTTKMIKCEMQSYDEFCKTFGASKANAVVYEDYVEVMDDLHNDNEAIDPNKDGQDFDDKDDDSVQSAQPSPQIGKRSRKEKTSTGKRRKRMPVLLDLTSTFTNMRDIYRSMILSSSELMYTSINTKI
ncbi:hypothetical protein Cgig2_017255 [Carnegiea gigantea]|uniref:Uncharacterized protein n=1 Tax=Carnegiea gigantea TaxID=171969 RepID=A0A9Q1JLQ9_9CARY|nr:hypothetical protein Cgig2_017255 [Carnegiea gigantea]